MTKENIIIRVARFVWSGRNSNPAAASRKTNIFKTELLPKTQPNKVLLAGEFCSTTYQLLYV